MKTVFETPVLIHKTSKGLAKFWQGKVWYDERASLIGQSLTVRYQNLSEDDKIPRFPVGICIRDYE